MPGTPIEIGFGTTAALNAYQFQQADIGKLVPDLQASVLYRVMAAATGTAALAIIESSLGAALPLAGGTMDADAIITFRPSNAGADLQKSQWKIVPSADGAWQSAPFQMTHLRAIFGTTYDHSTKLGWNIPGSPEHDDTQGACAILWEHNYDSTGGAGVIWDEMHWSMWAPGGAEVRVFSSTVDWVSGVVSAGHYCDSIFVSLRSGAYISLSDSTGLALYKSRNLYMYDSVPTKKQVLGFNGTALELSESTTQLNIKANATYTDGSLFVGDSSANPHEFKVIGGSGQYFRAYVSAGTTQVISAQTMLFTANAGGAYQLQLYNGGVALVGDINLSNGTLTSVLKVSASAPSGGADGDIWVRKAGASSSLSFNVNGSWKTVTVV